MKAQSTISMGVHARARACVRAPVCVCMCANKCVFTQVMFLMVRAIPEFVKRYLLKLPSGIDGAQQK